MNGTELRAYRDRMGFTQAQLGEALSVARNTIARWERDELQPENPAMLKLALEQLETQAALQLKGKAGREMAKRLKMLQQVHAELKELVAQNSA
jgi:transcriptional regulator with XRE-family HTH domain